MDKNTVKVNMDIIPRSETYVPDTYENEITRFVLKELEVMIDQRTRTWPQLYNRTIKQFLDDSEKRLNAQIMTREEQGKEDWQANVALPTVRDKMTKMIAGFSLRVPELNTTAFGEDYHMDVDRAEIAKWLITGSYTQEENPVLENFWESWHCAGEGTVIKYEGYLKTKMNKKIIKSYDITTGKVEYTEREVDIDDKCVSLLLPLLEFYPKSLTTHSVQDQPAVAWVRYMTKEMFEYEFGGYAKAQYVKTKGELARAGDHNASFFVDFKWQERTGDEMVEVVRYYNRFRDMYVIIANGIVLLSAPMLWEVNGVKQYPFAKTIWAPFINKFFFYGNSAGNMMMAQYDMLNTTFNTVMDREFRSLVPFLLVGRINQGAFDLEDSILTLTTKITVDDVNQVKELNLKGPDQTDLAMIEMIARGIDESAQSLPSLLSGKDPTAREVVLAEEKLRELKTVHQEMLSDLWKQKAALRLANIQLNYPQPRKIAMTDPKTGEVVEKTVYRTYVIPNAILERDTGERGILAIQFRPFPKSERKKIAEEIAVEEEMLKQKGINYKKIIAQPDYLDNFLYQMEIVPESLHRTSLARLQSVTLEKLGNMQTMFPQIFVVNQEDLFREFSQAYDMNPDKYLQASQKFDQQKEAVMGKGMAEQPTPGAPEGESPMMM